MPTQVWLNCSAAGNPFNLPVTMDGSAVPASVLPGQSFDATISPEVTLTQDFIQGALITGYTIFFTPITDVNVTNVRVRVPVPSGSSGALTEFNWSEGTQTVGVANPDFDPGLPASETNIPSFATGDFVFTPPSPITQTFTATGAAGSDIEFELGADPLRIDLAIGALPLPIICGSVATEIPDPSVDPQTDPPTTIPFNQTPFLTVPITAAPVPTADITSVTGQVVDNAARAGNEVAFGGPNWSASSAIDVELCDLAETACSAAGLSGVTAAIDGSGVLSGTATIDPAAGTGAQLLRVSTDQAESDTDDLLILGAPTISAPGNAGEGAPIVITGTNWNPNSPSTAVQFLNATGDTVLAGPFVVTVDSTGAFSTTQTVVADTGIIAAGEGGLGYPQPPGPATPGSLFAIQTGFQVSSDECTVPGSELWSTGGPTGQSCSIQQTILLDVLPGTLSMSQAGGIVDLGDIQLTGTSQFVSGAINEVTVVDATGSLFGWDLSATMTDLENGLGGGSNVIPASDMEWTPSCDPIDASVPPDGILDGNPAEVISGPVADLDNTVGATLCTAAPGGGGGTFAGNADLNLFVGASTAAGSYQATMTLLLM